MEAGVAVGAGTGAVSGAGAVSTVAPGRPFSPPFVSWTPLFVPGQPGFYGSHYSRVIAACLHHT